MNNQPLTTSFLANRVTESYAKVTHLRLKVTEVTVNRESFLNISHVETFHILSNLSNLLRLKGY